MNKNIEYSVIEGKLFIDGNLITLPFSVIESIDIADVIIVRMETPANTIFNNNIYGFDFHGKLLWKIDESPHGRQKDKPYMSLVLSNKNVIVGNWNGVEYRVDPNDGSITVVSFKK